MEIEKDLKSEDLGLNPISLYVSKQHLHIDIFAILAHTRSSQSYSICSVDEPILIATKYAQVFGLAGIWICIHVPEQIIFARQKKNRKKKP